MQPLIIKVLFILNRFLHVIFRVIADKILYDTNNYVKREKFFKILVNPFNNAIHL